MKSNNADCVVRTAFTNWIFWMKNQTNYTIKYSHVLGFRYKLIYSHFFCTIFFFAMTNDSFRRISLTFSGCAKWQIDESMWKLCRQNRWIFSIFPSLLCRGQRNEKCPIWWRHLPDQLTQCERITIARHKDVNFCLFCILYFVFLFCVV